ncbi:cell division protein FtsZ [Priestia megaterium]|uniref:cell division protein FtsZ n=1 Tax=Priestia megaterium TaxID=1404 RepID=UPI000BFB4794|nr:cell division protein FtsZ [Priestia megaterium]PGQ88323.1 cell division protein FtsZ [Priestia megaterium]
MIGIVGIGAAGGNIADLAFEYGIPAIAMNFSERDLESLDSIEQRLTLIGSEGVGKNRDEAINLMVDKNWEMALKFVKENFSSPSTEIIMVCFSAGGGSGGGIGPMLSDLLGQEMEDKTIVAVPILPDTTEALVHQVNALYVTEELSRQDLCVLPIDNEQVKKRNPNAGKAKIFRETNETFVNLITSLPEYTDRHSKHGVLDRKDLRTIFSTKGIASVSSANITKLNEGQADVSNEGITEAIKKSWENAIFAPLEMQTVSKAGIIYEGPLDLFTVDSAQVFSSFKGGEPTHLFEGTYEGDHAKVTTILAGMPYYSTRLNVIEEKIEAQQKITEELPALEAAYESKLKLPKASPKKPLARNKKKAINSILDKYQNR